MYLYFDHSVFILYSLPQIGAEEVPADHKTSTDPLPHITDVSKVPTLPCAWGSGPLSQKPYYTYIKPSDHN